MPISSSAATRDKRKSHFISKPTTSDQTRSTTQSKEKDFLTIGPALPPKHKLPPSQSRSTSSSNKNKKDKFKETEVVQQNEITSCVSRIPKDKEKHPDRVCLDRRGLTVIPVLEDEPKLRLLSLQHNLINSLEGFKEQSFQFLVFLDVYDNQLDKIGYLEKVDNLRVLLLGKNRIKKIEGLQNLSKLEVLDLHGNQIQNVTGLSTLSELKVLNLAGNQLKTIGSSDLQGLNALQELNLRRNKIRKLLGFGSTPNLLKLFLSNNDVQTVEDMTSITKSTNIKEISIDNNPVFLNGDCASFLVSFLPLLTSLNSMQITEQVRKAAMAWRRNKESTSTSFMDLSSDASLNGRREEVISNARTNWELLRSQTKCLTSGGNCAIPKVRKLEPDVDFILTSLSKPENRNVLKVKSKPSMKVPILNEKKIVRSGSQDTDNSQNTSSSNSGNEFFRLPPILVPIINKMEKNHKDNNINTKTGVKLSGSLSSIGPNVDSSVSSLNSTHSESDSESSSSESESESIEDGSKNDEELINNDQNMENKNKDNQQEILPNLQTNINPTSSNTSDSSSNISTNTAISSVTIPSTSTDLSKSSKSRSVKSAVNSRLVQTKVNSRAATAKPKKSSPQPAVSKEREQGGDYLIEICGRHLNIYGQGALRFIDKPWSPSKANDVITINFNYANFNGITPVLSKIKTRFPNAENFSFKETNIQYIGQLNALAEIQGLVSLSIGEEGNPIMKKPWRSYAIYRLSHWGLKFINGENIEEDEITTANTEYQSLSDLVLWSLPEPLLQPLLTRLHIDLSQTGKEQSAKKWLLNADPALKSVVSKEALQWKKGVVPQEDLISRQKAKLYCSLIIDQTCNAIKKLRLLDEQWPAILQDIVQNTLLDYSQMDMYMKKKMKELT